MVLTPECGDAGDDFVTAGAQTDHELAADKATATYNNDLHFGLLRVRLCVTRRLRNRGNPGPDSHSARPGPAAAPLLGGAQDFSRPDRSGLRPPSDLR